jgi:hypothetical protein
VLQDESLVKGWKWYKSISSTFLTASITENQDFLVSRAATYDFFFYELVPDFFHCFDNCKHADQGVLSGWYMLSTLLECWFQSSKSSTTLATSDPVVTQRLKAVCISFNQLMYRILWCRYCSACVTGRLGFMRSLLYFEAVFYKHSRWWVPQDAFQKVQSCPSNALEST